MLAFFLVFSATIFITSGQVLLKSESDLKRWSYYNGDEFPGARGNLTWSRTNNAVLTYDFTHPTNPFNPEYVAATIYGFSVSAGSTALSLDFQCINATLVIRYIDSTNQVFQIPLNGAPLELEDLNGATWHRGFQTPIMNSSSHWGGANDGIFHYPLTGLWLIAQGEGPNSTGSVYFNNVQLVSFNGNVVIPVLNPANVVSRDTSSFHERLGVNIHFTQDDRALDIIKSVGFQWIRMDFAWGAIENPVGTYTFQPFDALVTSAENRGIHTLAVFDYGHPHWTGGYMNPPVNSTAISAFGNYVFATVQHFTNRDVTFEVWNEPDIPGFWAGNPNPVEYARLLIETLKRGRDARPSARILTGGMSSPPPGYRFWDVIDSMNAAAGATGLGTHLYVSPGGIPELRWADVVKLGPIAKKLTSGTLWCTEWGFSSTFYSPDGNGHDSVGRTNQAIMAVRQMIFAWWADLSMLIYYDIRDDGNDGKNSENNFGLLASDYSDKPAMTAVRFLFSLASSCKFVGLLVWDNSADGLHVALWENSSEKIYVAWLDHTPYSTVTLSIPKETRATFFSVFGDSLQPNSDGTNYLVEISKIAGPVYIIVPKSVLVQE